MELRRRYAGTAGLSLGCARSARGGVGVSAASPPSTGSCASAALRVPAPVQAQEGLGQRGPRSHRECVKCKRPHAQRQAPARVGGGRRARLWQPLEAAALRPLAATRGRPGGLLSVPGTRRSERSADAGGRPRGGASDGQRPEGRGLPRGCAQAAGPRLGGAGR
ncbi:hypothetical protein PF003_g40741 [Phytophthora fragariae]|nr:hypothetical protein PF003_g40741 [Phytophthora fragariae]